MVQHNCCRYKTFHVFVAASNKVVGVVLLYCYWAPYHHRLALLLLSPLCLIKSIACSKCVSGNIGERPEPPFGLFRIYHEFVLIESRYSLCEANC